MPFYRVEWFEADTITRKARKRGWKGQSDDRSCLDLVDPESEGLGSWLDFNTLDEAVAKARLISQQGRDFFGCPRIEELECGKDEDGIPEVKMLRGFEVDDTGIINEWRESA